jgi:hypothetical protein
MGTNYYYYPPGYGTNPFIEKGHIGKSSYGWCFAVRIYPDKDITTLNDWRALFAIDGSYIENEYGERVTPVEMIKVITDRQPSTNQAERTKAFFDNNHAVAHPSGLLRARVGPYCVGHGEGTYDYIDNEFS